jgi:hypothetical protein
VLYRFPADHDLHNFLVGAVISGGACKLLAILVPRLVNIGNKFEEALWVLRWTWKSTTIFFVAVFWMAVPPYLTGFLFQAVVLNPIQMHHDETPRYALLPCWSFGLVLLKLWAK